MNRNKWDLAKITVFPLPFLFLAAWLGGLGFPLPAFLAPTRTYLALSSATLPADLAAARIGGETFLVLGDRLTELPGRGEFAAGLPDAGPLGAALAGLPGLPILGPVLKDLEGGLGKARKARIIISRPPSAAEIAQLRAAALKGGIPLSIEVLPSRDLPIAALTRAYSPTDRQLGFELLLSPRARELGSLELRGEAGPGQQSPLLYRGTGKGLPDDLVLRLSVDREKTRAVIASFTDASQGLLSRRLQLAATLEEEPKVLVISARGARESFVEKFYPTRRASPAEAGKLDLLSYELVVVDGVPIKSIRGSLLEGLLELADKRSGSLLFAADSPDFGSKGENPKLEAILPDILMPRDVKDLPDLGILVLIDVSGSMFGDKLSLAKVTGLELLHNLKPGDLIGLMLFSDVHSWVHQFEPNSSIVAAPELEPLSAGGGTDLAPALVEGLERLSRLAIRDKHAVVISDGVTKPADFQAIADSAKAKGISISAMGIGEDVNRALLERLALGTGGRYYRVASADQIPALLFEDRQSVARPPFTQGRIPVLALNGQRVALIGGMAQYAPVPTASVVFTNDLGDPLLASREYGNRAVILFASDLYGTYTRDFFASAGAAFKDRLDALFSEKPARIGVAESAEGLEVIARSDRLAAPRLLLSRAGSGSLDLAFRRRGSGAWAAEAQLPERGEWSASILDRGGTVASFPLAVNGGFVSARADSAAALAAWRPLAFRTVREGSLWLLLFFLACLAATVIMRIKR